MGTDDLDQIDDITANTVGIVHLIAVLAVASLGGGFAVAMKRRARRTRPVGPARRSNVAPSLIILVGLTLAGLGTLEGRTLDYFPGPSENLDERRSPSAVRWYSQPLRDGGEPSLWDLSKADRRGRPSTGSSGSLALIIPSA